MNTTNIRGRRYRVDWTDPLWPLIRVAAKDDPESLTFIEAKQEIQQRGLYIARGFDHDQVQRLFRPGTVRHKALLPALRDLPVQASLRPQVVHWHRFDLLAVVGHGDRAAATVAVPT